MFDIDSLDDVVENSDVVVVTSIYYHLRKLNSFEGTRYREWVG